MKICFLSIDVEPDIFGNKDTFNGVERLNDILDIFERHKADATLFVTGEVLERYPELVKNWDRKNFEIACHNYSHIPLDRINFEQREEEVKNFIELFQKVLMKNPKGFRAPRNIIDNKQFEILEKYRFLYDSSVVPAYPWPILKYEGYKGRAPLYPYYPSPKDYKKKNDGKILEIPLTGLILGVPLVGTWLRKLGTGIFKKLFLVKKPDFLSFSMHSWDGVEFRGKSSRNSGRVFLRQLDEMLRFLKNIGYEFRNGEQIYRKISN